MTVSVINPFTGEWLLVLFFQSLLLYPTIVQDDRWGTGREGSPWTPRQTIDGRNDFPTTYSSEVFHIFTHGEARQALFALKADRGFKPLRRELCY